MCSYITLIAATEDDAALSAVMARHGRIATPIDNRSVARVLKPGERQFVTTRRHCDCGTVLAVTAPSAEDEDRRAEDEVARLVRKGWSAAKIARAVEDRRKRGERPRGAPADSLEMWGAVVGDVLRELRLSEVGLLVHFYSGGLEGETIDATRRAATTGCAPAEALASMALDEVLVFRRRDCS